jgi:hypothetical protein
MRRTPEFRSASLGQPDRAPNTSREEATVGRGWVDHASSGGSGSGETRRRAVRIAGLSPPWQYARVPKPALPSARGGRPRTRPEAPGLHESELRRRLAAALTEAFKADGRSLREIAEDTWGRPEYATTISRWASGERWPGKPQELEQLCATLGLDPGELFAARDA